SPVRSCTSAATRSRYGRIRCRSARSRAATGGLRSRSPTFTTRRLARIGCGGSTLSASPGLLVLLSLACRSVSSSREADGACRRGRAQAIGSVTRSPDSHRFALRAGRGGPTPSCLVVRLRFVWLVFEGLEAGEGVGAAQGEGAGDCFG